MTPEQKLIEALFKNTIQDLTSLSLGQNIRQSACKFFFQEASQQFHWFSYWCDAGDFDQKAWQKQALMHLAWAFADEPRLRWAFRSLELDTKWALLLARYIEKLKKEQKWRN